MMNVLITGGTSGLGLEIAKQLKLPPASTGPGWYSTINLMAVGKEEYDLSYDPHVSSLAQDAVLFFGGQKIDVLINCAGVNFIDWHEDIPLEKWDELMNVNARAMWLLTKKLINLEMIGGERMQEDPVATIVNIVSNASHVPMTNSAAYNASKGAAAILTRQMARELRKTHSINVFGVSPNKMHSTEMSDYIEERVCELRGWTPEETREYQAAALPALKETCPKACAEFICFLLSTTERNQYLNGCIMEYGI